MIFLTAFVFAIVTFMAILCGLHFKKAMSSSKKVKVIEATPEVDPIQLDWTDEQFEAWLSKELKNMEHPSEPELSPAALEVYRNYLLTNNEYQNKQLEAKLALNELNSHLALKQSKSHDINQAYADIRQLRHDLEYKNKQREELAYEMKTLFLEARALADQMNRTTKL